jgi:hypothetical protein
MNHPISISPGVGPTPVISQTIEDVGTVFGGGGAEHAGEQQAKDGADHG